MSNLFDLDAMAWYGLKPMLKRLASAPLINHVIRGVGWAFLPAARRVRLPVGLAEVIYRTPAGPVMMRHPRQCQVAQDIYWGKGRRSQPADDQVMQYLESKAAGLDLFLDIGAYSGVFALVAARLGAASVAAYEIVPANHRLLVSNIERNGLVVDAQLRGLGSAPGEIIMPDTLSLSALPSSFNLATPFDSGVTIPVTTLDDEYTGVRGNVLMKLDVEGFEAEVLRGAKQFLAANRPEMICEVLERDNIAPPLMALLAPLGYRFYQFMPDGPQQRQEIVPDRQFRDWLITTAELS